MTNRERINMMTDKELANLFASIAIHCASNSSTACKGCNKEYCGTSSVIKWLNEDFNSLNLLLYDAINGDD